MEFNSCLRSALVVVTVALPLTSCAEPKSDPEKSVIGMQDSLFEKKLRCTQLTATLENTKTNQGWQIDSVFYSPKLNTCILTKSFVDPGKKAAILEIRDALTGEILFADANAWGKPVDDFMGRVRELRDQKDIK